MKTFGSKSISKILFLLPCILMFQSYTLRAILPSRGMTEETWRFPRKDTLSLETMGKTKVYITGSNSEEIGIKLLYISKPDVKIEVKEKQRTISLEEHILNYNPHVPTQTYFEECTIIITVPNGIFIKCNGNSSDYEVTNFNGAFKAVYASGKFIFKEIEGSIDVQMATLTARIHNSRGSFHLSSAIGSIRARGLTVNGNSNFSSGMGDIKISLAKVPEADLFVSSSFSKAKVNFNGHPVAGYFEFICRADEGKIISPFEFEKEETFLDDILNYNTSADFGKKTEYNRKSFILNSPDPKITLKTVTGTAHLTR